MYSKGDYVCKKSKKPFQNGKRIGVIYLITKMHIPNKGMVDACMLEGCKGLVTLMTLSTDDDKLQLLAIRDNLNLV